ATSNTALIAQRKEIGPNLLLTEHIGRAHVVGREPAACLDVDVPGPPSKTRKPHVVDHTLTQRGHGRSPFEFRHQELGPGTRADTPARSPQRLHPPTAKPFSPTDGERPQRACQPSPAHRLFRTTRGVRFMHLR